MKKDREGQQYLDVGYVRLTAKERTWAGHPGISVRAYREDGGLHRGAEIPLEKPEDILELILGVVEVAGLVQQIHDLKLLLSPQSQCREIGDKHLEEIKDSSEDTIEVLTGDGRR